ncbi:mutS protein homolog 5-like [Coccinella septempunctata]|uniref:mutS protein homolog 5-like n=1 Tax=Coccinella septempunctata TaxID=41139 RepID=UPI001D05FED5|nr:mutS protein homolog 5-like [Coccinella septempunctata]
MDLEHIFQLKGTDSNRIETSSSNENRNEFDEKVHIMCILWKSNKLGAAYYSLSDSLFYVYEEYIDVSPHFSILKRIFQEVSPKYTICIGSSTDAFVKSLIDTINDQAPNTTTSDIRSLPPNFYILSMKEYPYEICKAILQQVEIASFPGEGTSDILKEMYIQSLINFDCKMSIYAAGALIKYLDKNWAFFSPDKELQILYIYQVTIKNHVLIDWTSFNALQIFNQKPHEAGFKRGVQSNSREGLSIYKLYSSHCKSRMGQLHLRNLLLNPIFDKEELNKRLDFIQFALQPCHKEFIESIQDNIKNLVEVNLILQEIGNSKAKSGSWQNLNKTIYHTILINELSGPLRSKCKLLTDLNNAISSELIGLHQSIQSAFDFSTKFKAGRPIIKFGIDADLDAKKLQRQDIAKHVTAAARIAVEELPDFLTECAVVYLPEMGHLVAVKEWEPNCNPEELGTIGYKFMFTVGGSIHYKSPLCVELDKGLGDINAEIVAHENRIIQRLSGFVLKYNKDIREPLKFISLIDSLIAMARVAAEKNFVKPTLNDDRVHEIEDGRHPLMEEMFAGFVPNNFYSGGKHSHVKIITGPNGSGKSIYLKQIGIITYLAHVGSYVPAKKANIGVTHSLHFRTATESVSVRLSAFMIDVTQITQAIYNATPSSLVIMDEFGKGTSDDDGLILMVGVLRKFLKENENCCHILVSTHYQQVMKYLSESPLLEYQKMGYTRNAEEPMVLLYKLESGVSESFAFDIAEEVGLDPRIIRRAREIFDALKNGSTIKPLMLRNHPC